jgi:hypothetical protein
MTFTSSLFLKSILKMNKSIEFIKVYFIYILGSMDGHRIANAKEALFLFLKSLPSNCYFNIISFGSQYSSLFSRYFESYLRTKVNMIHTLHDTKVVQESVELGTFLYTSKSVVHYFTMYAFVSLKIIAVQSARTFLLLLFV